MSTTQRFAVSEGRVLRTAAALCAALLTWHAHAEVIPTGGVDAVDVASGDSSPLEPSSGDLILDPGTAITILNGQLLVNNGSALSVGANQIIDSGLITVTGPQTRIDLTGNFNRLDLQGPASVIQILNGAVIDATGGICDPATCNLFLGNFPGADATVLVDGIGSQLNTINSLVIAGANTDFGQSGADSVAVFDLSNGGIVNAESTVISPGLTGSNIQPGQLTDATVNISGPGSTWNTGSFDVSGAFGASSAASVNVTNGAVINAATFAVSNNSSSVGDVLVDGIDSVVSVAGNFFVGAFGDGSLTVSNGALVQAGDFAAGRFAGSDGLVIVDGIGTNLAASNVFLGVEGAASATISGGAALAADGVLILGSTTVDEQNARTGDVELTLDGAGSSGSVAGPVTVGFIGGQQVGTSTVLQILNGATFTTSGAVGVDTNAGDQALLTVAGAGSSLATADSLFVGSSGAGAFRVDSQGAVSIAGSLIVGGSETGVGAGFIGTGAGLDVVGSTIVGFSGGDGTLIVDGGAASADSLLIGFSPNPVPGGLGTISILNGGVVDGGSLISIGSGGSASATVTIDGNGSLLAADGYFVGSNVGGVEDAGASGTISVANGGRLDVRTNDLIIGFGAGTGIASVESGGAITAAGSIGIGFDNDANPNTGEFLSGELRLGDNAQVSALATLVGGFGQVSGTGTIAGDLVNQGGLVNPGAINQRGTLVVTGNYFQEAGALQFTASGTNPGEFDQLFVSGDIDLQGGQVDILFDGGFQPQGAQQLPLLVAQGDVTVDPAVAFNVGSGNPAFELAFVDATVTDPLSGLPVLARVGSFNFLDIDVAPTLGLSPNQTALATTFDRTCTLTAAAGNLTADEQDLLEVCAEVRNAGNTPDQISLALTALGTDETTQMVNALLLFTIPQHGNLSQRVNGIRSGSNPFDFTGLDLHYEGHRIAAEDLERVARKLIGGMAGSDDFARWGMFGNGNFYFGDQDATENGGGFDYETMTMTIGLDYRARDDMVFGGSASYSAVNADFNDGGGLDLKSWAVSAFGSYFSEDKYYLDLIGSYGRNDLETARHIVYQTALGDQNRRARADTKGNQYSLSAGFGYDFTPGAWIFGPHGGGNFTELEAHSYTEKGAGGLNLDVGQQAARSLTANVGLHASYTLTPSWGVIVPYLRADMVREFKDTSETITVKFASDRFADDLLSQTPIIPVKTDARDRYYQVYSLGTSVQLINGVAGFVNYRTTRNLQDISLSDVTWGIRFERAW
ncbi:MAG: autotransporter domain-containing protein [Pseudomonadales bacterium]